MKSKEKIAIFFVNSFEGGGAERVALNLAGELSKQKIKSIFVTLYKSKKPNEKYIEEWNLNLKNSNNKFLNYVNLLQLKKELNKNSKWLEFNNKYSSDKYEVVLSSAHLLRSKLVADLSFFSETTLFTYHVNNKVLSPLEAFFYKLFFNNKFKNKKSVFVSKELQKKLVQKYKLNNKICKTIYNPVEVKVKTSKKLYKKPYIIFVGRLTKQKNPLKALDIYYEGKFFEDYDFIYLGEGELKDKLEAKCRNFGIENNVLIKNYQQNSLDWIKHASCLVSTSLYEGMPLNIIEALMLNTPVVAYRCPTGVDEIMIGNLKKYTLDVNVPNSEFIKQLSLALDKYPKINKTSFNKFNPSYSLTKYLEFYQQ